MVALKVIIDVYVPIAISLTVWDLLCGSFSVLVSCLEKFPVCSKAGLMMLNSHGFLLICKVFNFFIKSE